MRIAKIIYQNNEVLQFTEKPLEHFVLECKDERTAKWRFSNQYEKFEQQILDQMELDLEDWACDEFGLEKEKDDKELDDFTDEEIKEEAEDRGLFKTAQLFYSNILNENLTNRFFDIMNTGNVFEIENALSDLEKKYHLR